jgi:hypothetical protein
VRVGDVMGLAVEYVVFCCEVGGPLEVVVGAIVLVTPCDVAVLDTVLVSTVLVLAMLAHSSGMSVLIGISVVACLITYRQRAARTLFKHLEPVVQKLLEQKVRLDMDPGMRTCSQAVSHFTEAKPPLTFKCSQANSST